MDVNNRHNFRCRWCNRGKTINTKILKCKNRSLNNYPISTLPSCIYLANTAMGFSNYPNPEKNKLSILELKPIKKIITKGFCFSNNLNEPNSSNEY